VEPQPAERAVTAAAALIFNAQRVVDPAMQPSQAMETGIDGHERAS
jgi:hypothetical protein